MKTAVVFLVLAAPLLAQFDFGSALTVYQAVYPRDASHHHDLEFPIVLETTTGLRRLDVMASVPGTGLELVTPSGESVDLLQVNRFGIQAEPEDEDLKEQAGLDPSALLPYRRGFLIEPFAPVGVYQLRIHRPAAGSRGFRATVVLRPGTYALYPIAESFQALAGSAIPLTVRVSPLSMERVDAVVRASGHCYSQTQGVSGSVRVGKPVVARGIQRFRVTAKPRTSHRGPFEWRVGSQNQRLKITPAHGWMERKERVEVLVEAPIGESVTPQNLQFEFFKGVSLASADSLFRREGYGNDFRIDVEREEEGHCGLAIEATDPAGTWKRNYWQELRFLPPPAKILRLLDYSADTNHDGFLDEIGVTAEVQVFKPGDYRLSLALSPGTQPATPISSIFLTAAKHLEAGFQTITASELIDRPNQPLSPGIYQRLNVQLQRAESRWPDSTLVKANIGPTRVYQASEFPPLFRATTGDIRLIGQRSPEGDYFEALRVSVAITANQRATCRLRGTLVQAEFPHRPIGSFQGDAAELGPGVGRIQADVEGGNVARLLTGSAPVPVTIADTSITCYPREFNQRERRIRLEPPFPQKEFLGSDFQKGGPDFEFESLLPASFIVKRGDPPIPFEYRGLPFLAVAARNGWESEAEISFRDVPEGLQIELRPLQVRGTRPVRFTLQALPGTKPGPATFTVAARALGREKMIKVTVEIQ